jgi:GntR family transcriptional regulator
MDALLVRHDAIPLYHQIFLALRDEILGGRRPQGSLLPTEHQLAEMYSVSRITARRALDELAQNDFVERKRRTGTRVIYKSALLAFTKDTRVKVISVKEVQADAEAAQALGLATGGPVVRAVRLRILDGEPLGEIISHIPATVARGMIDKAALQSKPILSVIQDLGHKIVGGWQNVSALSADPALAATLEIEPRAAILQVERVVTGEGGAPLLHTVASYRADRYRLSLDLRGTMSIS